MNNPRVRNFLVYGLLILAIGLILWSVRTQTQQPKSMTLSEVAQAMRRGEVDKVSINNDDLTVTFRDKTSAVVRKESTSTAPEQFAAVGVSAEDRARVEWEVARPSEWAGIIPIIGYILPAVFVMGLIYFMLRQAQGSNNQAMSFGKSRARMFTGDQPTVTFEDVAGAEEAKEDLKEVVEFLKEPEKFIQLGARIPKGVLLVGSPGTGKTLLAKAVSGEAGVPFFSISGSEFVEMFVGVGASRVRDLFDQAKRHSPCIVFVDEIDAVGRHRGAGLGGSHDEREQTLNQILVEMDGFDTDTNVIVVAATNRPDILDPALMRPGRFDRRVVLDRPDVKGREAILKVHLKGKPVGTDVDTGSLAKSTPGFVGADIENMVNEAAILAARRNKKQISMEEIENSIERVMLGPERKSKLITAKEKEVIAYHEAGHAVVARATADHDPVRKVTIIPRGVAGGVTWFLPSEDMNLTTRGKLKAMLAGAMGGRAAEELVFGEITNGASGDIAQITDIARTMVTRWGMSEKLGPMTFGKKEELVFLGKELGEQRDYSDSVAQEIDAEVRKLVKEAHEAALKTLREHRAILDRVAKKLMEIETLDMEAFEAVFNGQEPPTESPSGGVPTPPRPARPAPESPAPTKGGPIPVPSGA
ncbi:MAG: ATP-dependent zinc metalloprotease FtsH [Chloroflexi bacterium]|nr:ATP-dependent zinc metalloprotease FtsH [Chloroflexota bacterium]MBI5349633.1 ATP-dependent zinc metalloprotease FtsH [Chloroflexota bacterium]MBI5712096.1 ATP-dependent zinc metalloprotease FtsH [Chloroflexota bacterium]